MSSIPATTAKDCSKNCEKMGLSLDAVVVMDDHAGCVCAVGTGATCSASSSAAMGGLVALRAAEEEEAEENDRENEGSRNGDTTSTTKEAQQDSTERSE